MRARNRLPLRVPCSFLLALLLLAAVPLSALEISDGRIRLTLIEGMGRFVISGQTKGGIFVPLLAAQDPRTTLLSIVVGNKIYRMGESSEFSEKAERVPGGARFTWKSSFLQATETFTFIPSLDSTVTSGVRIDLAIRNLSEQPIMAGARYLFDTYLGESGGVHFRTPTLSRLTQELTLKPADKAAWWESPLAGDPDQFGFQVMLTGTGITAPDKVVFANWKRLSDSTWVYDTSAVRDFNLLPYSVNDSAAAQYYEPRSIPHSAEVTITLAMGLYSNAGYSAAVSVPAASTARQNAGDDMQAVRADLSIVNTILNQIDSRLGNPGSVSDDEIGLIESTLRDLGSRAGRFTPAQ